MASRSLGLMAFFKLVSCFQISSKLIAKCSQTARQSFESIAGILQDENVVLVRVGGTLQIHFSVKFRALTHASFSSNVVLGTNTVL